MGVCAHEMRDVQLALFLCRVIWGPCSEAERRVLEQDVLPAAQQAQRAQQGGNSGGGGGGASRPALAAGLRQGPSAQQLGQGQQGQQQGGLEGAGGAASTSSGEALCRWLLGDASGAVLALLGGAEGAAAEGSAAQQPAQLASLPLAEAAQLLPLLCMLLPAAERAPAPVATPVLPRQRLCELLVRRCLAAAEALQCSGMPALALDPALAACKAEALEWGQQQHVDEQGQGSVLRAQLHSACALALLPAALRAAAAQQLAGPSWRRQVQRLLRDLQQLGLEVCFSCGFAFSSLPLSCILSPLRLAVLCAVLHGIAKLRTPIFAVQVDANAVLSLLRPMVHQLTAGSAAGPRTPAFLLPAAARSLLLQTQHSNLSRASVHSTHSAGSSNAARAPAAAATGGAVAGLEAGEGPSKALLGDG